MFLLKGNIKKSNFIFNTVIIKKYKICIKIAMNVKKEIKTTAIDILKYITLNKNDIWPTIQNKIKN